MLDRASGGRNFRKKRGLTMVKQKNALVLERPPLERAVQRALRAIAVDGLVAGVGGRLPTMSHYQASLSLGAGTVQDALSILQSAGAMTTVARGHLGRSVQSLDIGPLWALAALGTLRCVLPPAGSLEQRGLVEALAAELDEVSIPHTFVHQRGASYRLDRVRNHECDVAIASHGALSRITGPSNDSALVTLALGQDTYYSRDRVHVVFRVDWDHSTPPAQVRVALDRTSWDQVALAQAEFPPEVGYQYIDWSFPRSPVAIARGIADVAVWHRLQTLIPLDLAGLATRPLSQAKAKTVRKSLSEAILIMPSSRPEVVALFDYLDTNAIQRRQRYLLSLPPEHPELLEA